MLTAKEKDVIFDKIAQKFNLPDNRRYLIENMWDCAMFGDGTRDDYYCGAAECGSKELSDDIYREICQYI